MKTLYQYAIKTGNGRTVLVDNGGNGKLPIVCIYDDAENNPIIAANILRDLAKRAIEQAEIIEELETGKPIPKRKFCGNYVAQIVEVIE